MSQEKSAARFVKVAPSAHESLGPARSTQNTCCGSDALIGERLRHLRHGQGLSIRALAEKCGTSVNTLSLIENNRTSPSVHTLTLLAGGLGVTLATFFEEQKHEQQPVYQQAGGRARVPFSHGTLERLGEGLPPLGAEPILVTLVADQQEEALHSGREFIYCLDGNVTCLIEGRPYTLAPGDSLLFDAGVPHRWTNTNPQPSQLLVLFCPMEARDRPAEYHLDH